MTNVEGLHQIEDEVNASERELRPMRPEYETPGATARAAERTAQATTTTLPAVRPADPVKQTALQTIARDITRLTWREAELMSKGIMSKLKDKDLAGLTAALQDWAWEWEVFKEEERPRRKDDVQN